MAKQLNLGLMIGYWGAGPPARTCRSSSPRPSASGTTPRGPRRPTARDALTPLAWWGSQTSRIQLGTSIAQMSARTPTATAMAAITMDHLTNGRFILGLGASGPQVVEGWYGQPYPKPLARTREYVEIIRKILAREEPVTYDGEHYTLPYPGGTGLGKPVKSITHPLREDLPIYLAAEGPKNVALDRGDRRRLALDLLLAAGRRLLPRRARRRASPARARAGPSTTSRSPRRSPSSSTTTSRRRRASCGRCSRSTSAGWARGR